MTIHHVVSHKRPCVHELAPLYKTPRDPISKHDVQNNSGTQAGPLKWIFIRVRTIRIFPTAVATGKVARR